MEELLKQFLKEQGFFVDFEKPTEPDEKIESTEKVIGEMNDLEKGLYSFLFEKEKFLDELITKAKEAYKAGDNETLKKLFLEFRQNDFKLDMASKIMWASISSRFETSGESTQIGVREGFKVVEIYKENNRRYGMIIPGIGAIVSF